MATSFPETLRAFDADRRLTVPFLLSLCLLTLGAWGLWFVLPRIPVVLEAPATLDARGRRALAQLPAGAAARLHRGQGAWFRPFGSQGPERDIPAQVTAIHGNGQGGRRLELRLLTDRSTAAAARPGLTGTLRIELGRVAPARYLLSGARSGQPDASPGLRPPVGGERDLP